MVERCELCGHFTSVPKTLLKRIHERGEAILCWSCAREVANTIGRSVRLDACREALEEYRRIKDRNDK